VCLLFLLLLCPLLDPFNLMHPCTYKQKEEVENERTKVPLFACLPMPVFCYTPLSNKKNKAPLSIGKLIFARRWDERRRGDAEKKRKRRGDTS
jgi:hypothetical protein